MSNIQKKTMITSIGPLNFQGSEWDHKKKNKKKTDGLNNQSAWLPDAWNHLQRTVNKRDTSFDDLFKLQSPPFWRSNERDQIHVKSYRKHKL